jgi:hypothetical protein
LRALGTGGRRGVKSEKETTVEARHVTDALRNARRRRDRLRRKRSGRIDTGSGHHAEELRAVR